MCGWGLQFLGRGEPSNRPLVIPCAVQHASDAPQTRDLRSGPKTPDLRSSISCRSASGVTVEVRADEFVIWGPIPKSHSRFISPFPMFRVQFIGGHGRKAGDIRHIHAGLDDLHGPRQTYKDRPQNRGAANFTHELRRNPA